MPRLALLAALLLLAGCLAPPEAATTTTAPPPPLPQGPEPRQESRTFPADYKLLLRLCAAQGSAFVGGSASTTIQPEEGDDGLRATFTWTPVNPTAETMTVGLFASDGRTPLLAASGRSPITLVATAADLADGGAPEPLYLAAAPGACDGAPASASSSATQEMRAALEWNPAS